MIHKGKFSSQRSKVDNGIDRLKSLRSVLYIFFYFFKFFLLLCKFGHFFISLLFHLLQFLHKLNLFVIINKFIKITIIIIDDLNLISSFVKRINVCFKLLLKGLHVCIFIVEILNGKCVAYRINNFVIFFHFFNCCLMEWSPMQVEEDHNNKANCITNGNN